MMLLPSIPTMVWGGNVRLIGRGLGLDIDEITEELERRPLEAAVDNVMGHFEAGTQGAFWLKVIGKVDGRPRIVIDHITRIDPACAPDWPQPDQGAGDHRVIVHGDPDLTIPTSEAQLLFASANDPKKLLIFPGAGHSVFGNVGEQYLTQVERFIRESLAETVQPTARL